MAKSFDQNNKFEKRIDITQNDEISLKELVLKTRDWLHYLLSYWKAIILVGIVGAVSGYIFAYLQEPKFVATTTFVLEDGGASGGLGQYAGMAAMVGIDLGTGGGGLFQGDNILELYKSRSMLEKALLMPYSNETNTLLLDRYLQYKRIRESWKGTRLDGLSFKDSLSFSIMHDSIISVAVKDIRANILNVSKPDKKLSILQVSVTSPDEKFSKEFNDKLVSTVNRFYIDTKTKKSLRNMQILQRQTDSVRAVMSGAILSSVASLDATPNLNPTRQVLRVPSQRAQYNAETNRTILSELVKNLEIAKMAYLQETPLIQVIDRPIYPLFEVKRSKFQSLLIGGVISALITVIIIIINKIYREVLDGE